MHTQQNNHKCISEHTHTPIHTQGHRHTHKHTLQAGEKSEEMLMPTNTLRRRCVALMWSLSHTKANRRSLAGPIKLFSECCGAEMARLVNPVCSWQKCSPITQVCVVALLWSHLEGDHSLCVRWRGLVICREGLVMLCLLASVHQLSWLLRFRDFCFRGIFLLFFFFPQSTDTVREQHMKTSAWGKLCDYYTIVKLLYMAWRVKASWTLMCTCCVTSSSLCCSALCTAKNIPQDMCT